jgi:hypothetical protein
MKVQASPEGKKAEKALKRAVSNLIDQRMRLGLPVAVAVNGKAVFLSAARRKKRRAD